jgi:tetratricopeptide (TPR) repeat protein
LKNETVLSNFWGPQFNPLFVSSHLNDNNLAEVEKWLNKKGSTREPAHSKAELSREAQDFLELKKVDGLMALKKFAESEQVLKGIESKRYTDVALQLRLDSMRPQKKFSEIIKFGLGAVKTVTNPEVRKRLLSSLVVPATEGKLWKDSESLLKQAKLEKLEGKDLAPFLYLAGKSSAEQKNCKKSISYYSEAIVADPEHLASKEAKFRLGKCYLKSKKKDLAKKQWQEVVDSKDPFWGPLAKSEINLIGGP